MIRETNSDAVGYISEFAEPILLPYFGATENDNRYLSAPTSHIALNAD